jgi:flagellar basal-body rod modification protein FlgD
VEGVNLYNGDAQIIVNGVNYPMSSVMEVAQAK